MQGGSTVQGATTQFNASGGPTGAGTNQGSGHFRDGYFGSALIGHKIGPGLAIEGEGVYFFNNYNRATEFFQGVAGDSRTYGGLANIRFSIPYDYRVSRFAITPYVAVGAGYGDIRTRLTDQYTNNAGFMYQGKAGFEVKTGTPVSFDLGYRYIQAPETNVNYTLGGTGSFSQRTHVQAATFGIKYTF